MKTAKQKRDAKTVARVNKVVKRLHEFEAKRNKFIPRAITKEQDDARKQLLALSDAGCLESLIYGGFLTPKQTKQLAEDYNEGRED